MTAMVEARVQLLISRIYNQNDKCLFLVWVSGGWGGLVLSIDEKFLFRKKNGCTPTMELYRLRGDNVLLEK